MGTLKEIMSLFGTKNLLDIIKIEEEDCVDEKKLRTAYLKAALMYHPDKGGPGSDKDERTKQFQLLKEIYRVLGEKETREEYFRTKKWPKFEAGNIEEWIDLCSARLDVETIENFKKNYQGSQEERTEILKYYNLGKGSEIIIFDNIPFIEYLDEESMERVRAIVVDLIEKGEAETYDRRDESRKLKARISKAKKERKEFEEDQAKAKALNGKGGASGSGKKRKNEEEEPLEVNDLALQIRNKGASRSNFLDELEKKYAKKGKKK